MTILSSLNNYCIENTIPTKKSIGKIKFNTERFFYDNIRIHILFFENIVNESRANYQTSIGHLYSGQ